MEPEPYLDDFENEKPKRIGDDAEIYGAPDLGERPRVERPRRPRRTRWLLLGCVAVPLVCCVLPLCLLVVVGLGASAYLSGNEVTVSDEERVPVQAGAPLTLEIDNRVGSIDIVAGSADAVVVSYTKKASSVTRSRAQAQVDDIDVTVTQTRGTVRVEVVNDRSAANMLAWTNSVDFEIAVPPAVSLEIVNSVGRVRIEDVDAQRLNVRSNTGSIDFRGRLAAEPASEYILESNVGSIELRLPADTYVRVDAATDVGDISIGGGFDAVAAETDNRDGVRKDWRGTLGTGEDGPPVLRLRTNTGSIGVRTR